MSFYFCVVDIYFLSKFSFWRHSWRAFECVLGYISIPRCSIVNIYTLDFSLLGSGMGKTHEQYVVFCFQCIHCCFNLPCGGECGSSGNAGQGAYGTNLSPLMCQCCRVTLRCVSMSLSHDSGLRNAWRLSFLFICL